jgi:RHS repeat-associated protein
VHTWTSFDMPATLGKGPNSSLYVYGPEHQRLLMRREGNSAFTVYAGSHEVETKANGDRTIKTYWPMGLGVEIDKTVAGTTAPTALYWTHVDRLGSPVALTDASGALSEKLAFDAWGKRRTVLGDATPDTLDGVVDNKGFTRHEMLDHLDLVHMNGRVYDPLTAKFLSGDPLIQDPMNGQGYSRYTYVYNNPTNLTDPTGFAAETGCAGSRICQFKLEKAERQIDRAVQQASKLSDAAKSYLVENHPKVAEMLGVREKSSSGERAPSAQSGAPKSAGSGDALEGSPIRIQTHRAEQQRELGMPTNGFFNEFDPSPEERQNLHVASDPKNAAFMGAYSAALSDMSGASQRQAPLPSRRPTYTDSVEPAQALNSQPPPKFGVNDPPVRIPGKWTDADLKAGLQGRPPSSLGRPDLHHADQMPGSGIHEVLPGAHRGNRALHPNKYNQGVTAEMRAKDRQLHWWYRAQEQGARQRFPGLIYD